MSSLFDLLEEAPVGYVEADSAQLPPRPLRFNRLFSDCSLQFGFDQPVSFLEHIFGIAGIEELSQLPFETSLRNPQDGQNWKIRFGVVENGKLAILVFPDRAGSLLNYSLLTKFFSGKGDVFWILNLKTLHFDYVSPSVVNLRGYSVEEVQNQTLEEAVSPRQFPDLVRVLEQRVYELKTDPSASAHYVDFIEQPHKKGHLVPTEVNTSIMLDSDGQPDLLVGLSRDISRRQVLEDQLNQARRLESLGLMAAGIAHDFNNMLTAIQGNLDLALLECPSSLIPYLSNANKILSQAAAQIRQLMVFSGKARVDKKIEDLNKVIRDFHTMFKILIPPKVEFKLELSDHPLPVEVDAAMIQQIVFNLVQNAVDAMPRGGELRLATSVRGLSSSDVSSLKKGTELLPGDYAYLEVSDRGFGIAAELLDRIFEPFFTTKSSGKGLGLSSVLGIVWLHKGGLSVVSTPQEGTTFGIYLPFLPPQRLSSSEEKAIRPGLCTETESARVLVVDDEPSVRQVVKQMLELSGYLVDAASSGAEALRLIGGERRTYDLILLDLTMPGMDGLEVIRHLRSLGGVLPKIILMSGYHNRLEDDVNASGFDRYLTKPFRMDELCLLIDELIGPKG